MLMLSMLLLMIQHLIDIGVRSGTLVQLGGVAYKTAVDNLETECIDPAVEEHYKVLLRQWKNEEDNIKDELKEIGTGIKNLTKKIDDLVESTVSSNAGWPELRHL